jgi:hypothetical protein
LQGAAFPELAALCGAEISNAHLASVVCRLLLVALEKPMPENSESALDYWRW